MKTGRTLAVRDQHLAEHAHCIDCEWTRHGDGTRRRAADHAVKRNHRIGYVRTYAAELRPKTWPT